MPSIIVPKNEFTYRTSASDEEFTLSGSEVKQGHSSEISPPSYKGDNENWTTEFSAETEHGTIRWDVHISSGMEGINVEHTEITTLPGDIEVDTGFEFAAEECNDE